MGGVGLGRQQQYRTGEGTPILWGARQFHWSSRMEWPEINQSASATHQLYRNSVFLVSTATRTQFVPAIFWSF